MDTEIDETVAAIEFLSRSTTRVRLLSALSSEQPLSQRELRDRVDASRTTVQRNLDALEDRGWIRSTNREYETTTAGQWIADDFSTLADTVREADRLGPILDSVDTTAFDFDPRRVDFEVTTPDPGDPMTMITAHVQSLREADRVRGLLPEIGLRSVRVGEERSGGDGSQTLVLAEAAATTLRSNPDYREYFEGLVAAETVSIYVTEAEVPYYLGLLDDEVEIGISENGRPRALLTTSDPTVFEWAERQFEAYRADARPIEDD